jgi:hypothetical protein
MVGGCKARDCVYGGVFAIYAHLTHDVIYHKQFFKSQMLRRH